MNRAFDDGQAEAAERILADCLARCADGESMHEPVDAVDESIPPDLKQRFKRAQACLQTIARVQPMSAPAIGASQQSGQQVETAGGSGEIPELSEIDEVAFMQFLQREFAHDSAEADRPRQSDETISAATVHADTSEILTRVHFPEIDGYQILEMLGRGGMGIVYKARQTKLGRVVAVKMVEAGDSKDADRLIRFRMEAEMLASLQHRHIIQIHEVGEANARPFFSMEYAAGGSLADILDGTPWSATAAARLIEPLADGVQVAHDRGVIHRDLKPANILLTNSDRPLSDRSTSKRLGGPLGDRIAKISDFGLAKDLERSNGPTHTGDLLGTPSYMAPEQADSRTQMPGPAVDVYALGAVLYELLTGRPPFKAATFVETLNLLCSTELVPPTRLVPAIPRDLETICTKCLEKEPHKRYSSAAALADDLRRFQRGEAVLARPTPWWEQAWRWARRRPAAAALLVLSAVLLVMWFSFTFQLDHERQLVTRQRDEARQAQQKANSNFRMARAAIDILAELSDDADLQNAGLHPLRKRMLETAKDFYQQFLDKSDDPHLALEQGRAYERLGSIHATIGTSSDAIDSYRRSMEIFEALKRQVPDSAVYRDELARTLLALGEILIIIDQTQEAQKHVERALSIRQEIVRQYPEIASYRNELSQCLHTIGWLSTRKGKHEEAMAPFKRGIAIQQQLVNEQPDTLAYRRVLGDLLHRTGNAYLTLKDLDPAETYLRSALKTREELTTARPEHSVYRYDKASSIHILGFALQKKGHFVQAEQAYRDALEIREELFGENPLVSKYQYVVAQNQLGLAILLLKKEELDESAVLLDESLQGWNELAKGDAAVSKYQTGREATVRSLGTLVGGLRRKGRYSEAERVGRVVVACWAELQHDRPLAVEVVAAHASSCLNLGQILTEQSDLQEALQWYRTAAAAFASVLELQPNHPTASNLLRQSQRNVKNTLIRLESAAGSQ